MTRTRTHSRRRIPLIEFEHSGEPLLPLTRFWRRVLGGVVAGFGLIGGSLLIGVAGYHWLGRLGWVDSILNASMILTGMGPVDRMNSSAAKLFASAYALFSGVAFLTSAGVLFAPVVHRFMHRFHLGQPDSESDA
ncbi:MAG TPA: hypothetical protein VLV15_09800 [Dongiaceae bacterium]|nr:hypothetical protein [Dongiaceae bacterium]